MLTKPTCEYLSLYDLENKGEEGPLAELSQHNVISDYTSGGVIMELTWYDRSPWADVFINNVFSTLPSSDGRKISLKDAFPLGGIT